MSRFSGPLAVTFLSARSGQASLDQPLIWEAGKEGSGREVVIPRGFVSDGITAPRWLWWIIPPWGHGGTRAAMLHDFGLDLLRAGRPHPHMPTRAAVDREFRLALAACGVGPILRSMMWAGTRFQSAFDRQGWRRHQSGYKGSSSGSETGAI